jgi:hypothetical protein
MSTDTLVFGCTEPRVYTKPLDSHVNPLTGELLADFTDGPACIAFAEEMLGIELYPWQVWFLNHALELDETNTTYRFRIVITMVARQNGKALDVDTPMLTTDGWSTMGELKPGDQVYGPDGHPTEVVGAFDVMEDHECFEVETTDGRSIVADADHLWTVRDKRKRNSTWETLTTRELLGRGIMRSDREFAYRLPVQQCITSKPVDGLGVDPYVLGVWLGDGHSRSAQVSCGSEDVDEMCHNLEEAGAHIVSRRKDRTCWTVRFNYGRGYRGGFETCARQLGVWGNKHVPERYLTAGTDQRRALLAGLLDTDGSISDAGQVEFCSVSPQLADDVLYLARSLGYRATLNTGRATLNGVDCGPKYRVTFTPDDSPFRLRRKSQKVTPAVRSRNTVSIKGIRKVESRPVRCIKVAREDGLFLAGRDLMVTHNTTVENVLALWHMYSLESGLVIGTAQSLDRSEEAWKDCLALAELDDEMNEMIEERNFGHPKFFNLDNGCEYRVSAATRRGGRGFSGDLILLDELREHHNWDSWASVTNTMNARPFAQAFAFSNAGDSLGVVLRYQRALAHKELGWPDGDDDAELLGEDSDVFAGMDVSELPEGWDEITTALFEWSAPPEAKRSNIYAIAQANPALNIACNGIVRMTTRNILAAVRGSPATEVDTEILCRFIAGADGGPFPPNTWDRTTYDDATPGEDAEIVVCVEVSERRDITFISRCGRYLPEPAEGSTAPVRDIAVVGISEELVGTAEVVQYLIETRESYRGIVIRSESGSPNVNLLEDLKTAKLANGDDAMLPIIEWSGADIAAAHADVADRLAQKRIEHLPHRGMDTAALSAVPLQSPGGGWRIDIRRSLTDTAALYAAVGAVWGMDHLPDEVSVYATREVRIIRRRGF